MATISLLCITVLDSLGQQVEPCATERVGSIAMPTETFYGLAVDPFDEQALWPIVAVKGRVGGKADSRAGRHG